MIPAAFEYRRADSVPAALSALAELGDDARVLAGGQSLIPAMRYRFARPAALIDINPIAALEFVRDNEDGLVLGALLRDAALERAPGLRSRYPLLADVSRVVADPVVRQMGTIVGSLCHNDPSGDWPVAALAARASVAVSSRAGARVVPIDEFLVDTFATAVAAGEMATEVRFPASGDRTAGSYQKIERKVGDFATASAAVQLRLTADGTIAEAGVAIGAAGPTALRVGAAEALLRGAAPTLDAIRAAAAEAEKLADPVADQRGSIRYKKAMAGVLVARALTVALERLGVGGLR
ncbi:MAG TPA: FAD binding domain-containing protein [Candidatus Sulfotelmatobacter sp.]|nr:FAD binding domain-containing protein [Candidatus Sulfotelmatobacter sp.]